MNKRTAAGGAESDGGGPDPGTEETLRDSGRVNARRGLMSERDDKELMVMVDGEGARTSSKKTPN